MRFTICLIIALLNISSLFAQNKWELEKQKDNITVYIRKTANSKIKETKTFTVIYAPIQSICDVVRNGDEYKIG